MKQLLAKETGRAETVYGIEMPVKVYSIRYSCGCMVNDIHIACASVLPAVYEYKFACQKCDPTPACNVWD